MFPLLPREMKHLFARGEGGRHDWMRFHAHDVKCPMKITVRATPQSSGVEIDCAGVLIWKLQGKVLRCDQCGAEFKVLLKIQLAEHSGTISAKLCRGPLCPGCCYEYCPKYIGAEPSKETE